MKMVHNSAYFFLDIKFSWQVLGLENFTFVSWQARANNVYSTSHICFKAIEKNQIDDAIAIFNTFTKKNDLTLFELAERN